MPNSALKLAEKLIGIPSITPTDGGCQKLISERLNRLGFEAASVDAGGVQNTWIRKGTKAPLLCFAGHTDVVPTGNLKDWLTDPFVPTIRDEYLYGRGAADMKSSIAAFVVAAENFVKENPNHSGSIAMILTSDEEGPAIDGTTRVVEYLKNRGEIPDYCIVGEPTSVSYLGDTIKNGRRGSLSGDLIILGVQGHVAYPHLARNPVHLAAPVLSDLAKIEWDKGNEYFPKTTWQTSNISAGTGAKNVIPAEIQISFNFRFNPISTPDSLKKKVVQILEKYNLNYKIDWTLSAVPFLTKTGKLTNTVANAISEVVGIKTESSTTRATSDGRFISTICSEVVELGPINKTIHQINERILASDIDKLSLIYQKILVDLLSDNE